MLFLLCCGGVKLLVQEPVDDGGHSLRGVEVQVVATLQLPVHKVRVVFPEHALDAGVDLVRHVARALGCLDHQVRALDLDGKVTVVSSNIESHIDDLLWTQTLHSCPPSC